MITTHSKLYNLFPQILHYNRWHEQNKKRDFSGAISTLEFSKEPSNPPAYKHEPPAQIEHEIIYKSVLMDGHVLRYALFLLHKIIPRCPSLPLVPARSIATAQIIAVLTPQHYLNQHYKVQWILLN